MTADIYRDGFHYHLDFKKGENVGGLQKEPYKGRRTGSIIHWKPDDEVFTDIDVPGSYYKDVPVSYTHLDVYKRQALYCLIR